MRHCPWLVRLPVFLKITAASPDFSVLKAEKINIGSEKGEIGFSPRGLGAAGLESPFYFWSRLEQKSGFQGFGVHSTLGKDNFLTLRVKNKTKILTDPRERLKKLLKTPTY